MKKKGSNAHWNYGGKVTNPHRDLREHKNRNSKTQKDGLRECSRECMKKKKQCIESECRLWQDYPDEYNCTLVSVYEQGPMTLREVAEREHLSFARIKQIETKALKKLKSLNLIECFRF